MAKTNLQVVSTGGATGNKITTTLTHVNPDANSDTLKQFGRKLNALTTNVYGETNRIQTINVDSEEVPSGSTPKQTATATANPTSFVRTNLSTSQESVITYDGDYDGLPYVRPSDMSTAVSVESYTDDGAFALVYVKKMASITPPAGTTIEVFFPATANYEAATVTITLTD